MIADTAQLAREKDRLEDVSGTAVDGVRHHYWHLDPTEPHETLRRHEGIGFLYDSSLALEFYPGFRRGTCHPFRVFHPGERRELKTLQLPPAWMDDHFDRRLVKNGITDPVDYARRLVKAAADTSGMVLVDYHLRGMNGDFFPRYGPWLQEFLRQHLDSRVGFCTPGELARAYLKFEHTLDGYSRDCAEHEDLSLAQ